MHCLLLGSTELWMGKSRSDGLEILGDQKVARVARGFRVPVKIFSKKYLKNLITHPYKLNHYQGLFQTGVLQCVLSLPAAAPQCKSGCK